MKHLKYLSENIFFFFFLTYQCNAEGLSLRADSIATNEKITLGGIGACNDPGKNRGFACVADDTRRAGVC